MKEYKGKQKTAGQMLKGCSYAKGGKVHKPKVAPSETKQEEKADKEVGMAGKAPKERLDKLKRGGKAHKKGKTQVNVMVQPGEKKVPVPVPIPAGGPAGPAAPGLPPGLPPAPGAGMPPMGAKKGGKIKKRADGGRVPKMDAGAGGGLGRIEKSKLAAKKAKKENE